MKNTFKKIITFALVLAFMTPCLAGLGALRANAESTSEIELLQTAVSHLREDVDDLKTAIESKADTETVNAKIAELEAEIDTLNTELDSAKKETAELEAKSTELQTFSVIVCFISGISLGGCCALAIYVIIDRRKRTRHKTT